MRYLSRFVIAMLVIIGSVCQTPVRAQDQNILHIVGVDSSKFPSVEVTVSYTTASGEPVPTSPSFAVKVADAPMTLTDTTTAQKPLAAAIITDLSARMDDRGAGPSSRFANMQPLAQTFVSQLQGVPVPGSRGSLVVLTQTVTIAHTLTGDLQAVSNTLNNANKTLLFQPQTGGDATSAAPYPLGEALLRGLEQLKDAPLEMPRLLVVYAAGDAQQQVDTAALKQAFDAARNEKRPISLLVFGFGSDQPGEFTTFSANPAGLQQLASELNGTFIPISGNVLDEQAKRAIDKAYATLLQRSTQYVLHFTANNVVAGKANVEASAGGSTDTLPTTLGTAPPRFNVVVDSRNFQDRARLSIKTEFQQQPITEVKYFIDNIPIGAPMMNAPTFELLLDVYDAEFQSHFKPGEHTLTAAAHDATGNESRSEQPITVTVFARPAATSTLGQYWWVLAVVGVVVVGGGTSALLLRGRARSTGSAPRPATGQRSVQQDADAATSPYNAGLDEPTGMYNDEATMSYVAQEPEDKTLSFDPGAEHPSHVRWFLDILDGEQQKRVELSRTQRHYDIGRVMIAGRQAHIAIDNRLVSQTHAKLELFRDDLYLIAGESKNGTFFGEDQQPLAMEQRVQLHSGDVFWLSPRIKLHVDSTTEQS